MFLLIQKHDSTALARQGYTGIKKAQLLVQTVLLIEVSFFQRKHCETVMEGTVCFISQLCKW